MKEAKESKFECSNCRAKTIQAGKKEIGKKVVCKNCFDYFNTNPQTIPIFLLFVK